MRIEQFIYELAPYRKGISGLWYLSGDFGVIDGPADYTVQKSDTETVFCYETADLRVRTVFEQHPDGVCVRRDSLQNLRSTPLELNTFFSRFYLEGNRYQVYTQYNGCHHESSGAWQDLVTQVTAASCGIRACEGATPMMALRNLHHGKTTVFHMLPAAQWQITARKRPYTAKNEAVLVETGMENAAMRIRVAPGEVIDMPPVIFFQAQSATDLDAWKLHKYFNAQFPRREVPILYNTWLYCFDFIDVENILRQVDAAAELGIEYFVCDAGWFGEGGNWSNSVGDWEENLTGGYRGRLLEVAQRVREKGMKFGLWFEPERAGDDAKIKLEHPEFFLDDRFFDFGNPQAVDFMLTNLYQSIDHYGIEFIKFDFNASTPHDPGCSSFYRYMQGHKDFIAQIRQRYPQMYICGCGAGGQRMELYQGTLFDSFWLSDNQGPYEGLTIVKNTLKRMPTALIERWNVQSYCQGFPDPKSTATRGFMISCNNSSYDHLINVTDDYTAAFITGGPMGFSGDIAGYPEEYKQHFKALIAQYKQDREFYRTAIAHVLIDSDDITAIEYADPAYDKCVIQFFTKITYTNMLTVYPVLDATAQYRLDDTVKSGKQWMEDGIFQEKFFCNDCRTFTLERV